MYLFKEITTVPLKANSGSHESLPSPSNNRVFFPPTKSSLMVFELLQMHATFHPWAEITISAYIGSLKSPKYFPAWLTWTAQWKKEHDPPKEEKVVGLRSA